MRILFCEWGSVCEPGIKATILSSEHELMEYDAPIANMDYDTDYMSGLSDYILNGNKPDVVFSINFVPIISRLCNLLHIPYISWTVDCPCLQLGSSTVAYSCNYIFIFDRDLANRTSKHNPGHVFHLPLACDVTTLDLPVTEEDKIKFGCDVSFVGITYKERCLYNTIENILPDYMRGYIDGVLKAQQNIYGYSLLNDVITEDFAKEFKEYANWEVLPDYEEDYIGIMNDIYLGVKCTSMERPAILNAVSDRFSTDMYTVGDISEIPNIHNKGPADSTWMVPRIFKCSKINLNITLRSITSGIPQRVFDILGAGGFLISNYQPELAEFFVPDEDLVLYDSIPDLLEKIGYYLDHDNEREAIAANGHRKVQEMHSIKGRLEYMLSVLDC